MIRAGKRLGLTKTPKLAIGHGALEFWAALQEEFPETNHQLCWVHKTANVLDKLTKSLQGKAKRMIHDIYLAPTKKDANVDFDVFIEEFDAKYPKAVNCLRNHRERLLEFYKYPAKHWKHPQYKCDRIDILNGKIADIQNKRLRIKNINHDDGLQTHAVSPKTVDQITFY